MDQILTMKWNDFPVGREKPKQAFGSLPRCKREQRWLRQMAELESIPSMTHNLNELNQYTGVFTGGCLLALYFCVFGLQSIGKILVRFHDDYRKVNSMDDRERAESLWSD